jgi:KaiC/GvpD/RAD55 family RecA-like ATPase
MEITVKEIAPEAIRRGRTIPIEQFEKYRVNPEENLEEPNYILSYKGVKFCPQGDIQAIKAKPKSGKTLFMLIVAATVLGCEKFGLKRVRRANSVLYIDTEQNRRSTNMFTKRLYKMLGWKLGENHRGEFNAFSFREMEGTDADPSAATQRLQATISIIKEIKPKPTLCIIDGIADLVRNFNDVQESSSVVGELMKVAQKEDVAIINVLHTNKSFEDHNMKGHLGSFLLQKASDVIEMRKYKNGVFTAVQTETRNSPVDPIGFKIVTDGEDITLAPEEIKQEVGERIDHQAVFASLFERNEGNPMRYNDLVKAYMREGGVSDTAAKKHIKSALGEGVIVKTKMGTYAITGAD